MADNLIVEDREYEAVERFLSEQGRRYDNAMQAFIAALRQIKSSGIKKGETADAVDELIRMMERELADKVGDASRTARNTLIGFVDDIDRADGNLY